jgi:hypothetical protein
MATVPAPRTWAPGETPTATHFNTDIRDAVNFYKGPPHVQVSNSTDPDIVLETWTGLNWNTEDVDTDGMHEGVSHPSRLTATTAGFYQIFITVRWEWHADLVGARGVQLLTNANFNPAAGKRIGGDFRHHMDNVVIGDQNQCCSAYFRFSAGEYVEAFVWHSNDQTFGDDMSEIWHNPGAFGTFARSMRFGMIWLAQ